MADLWIFGRRPAAMVRHRHGGFNATFPMNGDTVVEQIDLMNARSAARKSESQRPPRVEGHDAQNVVRFQPRGSRSDRASQSPRGAGRPGPYRD